MKCAFCQRSEDDIRKDNGHIVAMKNEPEVSVCNQCVTAMKAGNGVDVNLPPKKIITYVSRDK